jgi:hypothetical protein
MDSTTLLNIILMCLSIAMIIYVGIKFEKTMRIDKTDLEKMDKA